MPRYRRRRQDNKQAEAALTAERTHADALHTGLVGARTLSVVIEAAMQARIGPPRMRSQRCGRPRQIRRRVRHSVMARAKPLVGG
jgi:hypothetical protein